MIHAKFQEIGLLVLEKMILKVCNLYGHGGHLGNVTWTIYVEFVLSSPKGST